MISILIPAYNFDVTNLVNTLHSQAMASKQEFEIIVLDDNSEEEFQKINRNADALSNVHYFELEKNIGRAAIRNRLADMAKFPYLLYMDCDAEILYNDFIENYAKLCQGEVIACGGWIYSPVGPKADKHKLRWKYGFKRESQDARERQRFPYGNFMTNNFLISKTIIQAHQFDETLKGYGHEDTLFAWALRKNNYEIKHIDNPMIHLGLETNKDFIKKSEHRLRNLLKVLEKINYNKDLEKHSNIARHFNRLNRWRLMKPYSCIYSKTKTLMLSNLLGKHPSLFVFDLYKLGYLSRTSLKKKVNLKDL